jgi:hypothetical protein
MSLRFELFGLSFHAAGVFFVNLSLSFQRPPVRGDILLAFGGVLFGCTSRNPGKDAGGYRSAEAGAVLFSQLLTYLVNRDKPAFRDLPHDFVHLEWRRNNHRTLSPPLTHLRGDFNYLGHIPAIMQLFPPAFTQLSRRTSPP